MRASEILRAAGLEVPEAVDHWDRADFIMYDHKCEIVADGKAALEALARESVKWKWVAEHRRLDRYLVKGKFYVDERNEGHVQWLLAIYKQEAKP